MWWILALGALAPSARLQSQQTGTPGLEVRAARFYRAATGQTFIDVFGRVPLVMVQALPSGAGAASAAYRVTFTVRDSNHLALVTQSWSQVVPASLLSLQGSSTAEHITFAAQPGRYTVEMSVSDSATGRVTSTTADLTAYGTAPAASDLLLASAMRPGTDADTTVGTGEVRKGSTILTASGDEVLTPSRARLGCYLELYAVRAETVSVSMRVMREDSTQVVAIPVRPLPLASGGGVLQEMLDLSGLPPGHYRLVAAVTGKDSVITRSAAFRMAGFEAERSAAAVAPDRVRVPFDTMTETELDEAYAPLIYLMRSDEQGIYSSLTLEGKRSYLRRFWAQREPASGTGAMRAFYARIEDANRRFREGGASEIPGWRTDRGRVFIRYGEPDETMQRPQAGNTDPYEVWKYTRGRALKFVFMDLTRFGNYSLIYTNDRHENSRPDWESLLGAEALTDVERF